jgi:hypothetical protein
MLDFTLLSPSISPALELPLIFWAACVRSRACVTVFYVHDVGCSGETVHHLVLTLHDRIPRKSVPYLYRHFMAFGWQNGEHLFSRGSGWKRCLNNFQSEYQSKCVGVSWLRYAIQDDFRFWARLSNCWNYTVLLAWSGIRIVLWQLSIFGQLAGLGDSQRRCHKSWSQLALGKHLHHTHYLIFFLSVQRQQGETVANTT